MKTKRFDRNVVRKALDKQKEEGHGGGFVDETKWKPTVPKKDKKTYKFIVLPKGNDVPWIKLRQHNVNIDGTWTYKHCPSTLGKKCPICGILYQIDEFGRRVEITIVTNICIQGYPLDIRNGWLFFTCNLVNSF